jgi:starch phosphorylase
MRESMACLTTQYSSNRMLREYVETYYIPLAEAYRRRADGAGVALQHWYQQLAKHWQHIHFGNITSSRTDQGYFFEVPVYLDALSPEVIRVEMYAEAVDGGEPFCQSLQRASQLSSTGNAYVYQGTVPDVRPATEYTPRIVPMQEEAIVPLEANNIVWYR